MAHPRFTRGRGRLGSKRETSWLPIDVVNTGIGGAGTILNSLTVAEKAKWPFTIIRTHLSIIMTSDQAAASENQIGGIGICVVSDQASAIGITAVPTPLTDLDSDLWLLHQLLFGEFLFGDGTGFTDPTGTFMTLDSKASRKVNDAEDVVIVGEVDLTLGFGASFVTGGRVLIKEH